MLDLRIIHLLDVRIVREGLLVTDVSNDLEAGLVQGIPLLLAPDVADEVRQRLRGAEVRFRSVDVGRRRGLAVAEVFVVVECGGHVSALTAWCGGG